MNEGLVSYEAFSSFFSVTFFPYGNKKKRGSLFKIGSERLVRVCKCFQGKLETVFNAVTFFFCTTRVHRYLGMVVGVQFWIMDGCSVQGCWVQGSQCHRCFVSLKIA